VGSCTFRILVMSNATRTQRRALVLAALLVVAAAAAFALVRVLDEDEPDPQGRTPSGRPVLDVDPSSPACRDDGKGGAPFCDLEPAIAAAEPGTVIRLAPGKYPPLSLDADPGRTRSLTVRGAPGHRSEISGMALNGASHLRFERLTFSADVNLLSGTQHVEIRESVLPGERIRLTGASHVTIAGNRIHDVGPGGPAAGLAITVLPAPGDVFPVDIAIRGNRIERTSEDAIQVTRGEDVVIEHNSIRAAQPSGRGEHTDAIQILGGTRVAIRANDIRDVAHGLVFTSFPARDVLIEGNLVTQVTNGYALNTTEEGMPGLRVRRNTFHGTRYGALFRTHEAEVTENVFDRVGGLGAQPRAVRNIITMPVPGQEYGTDALLLPAPFAGDDLALAPSEETRGVGADPRRVGARD
jgi:hypothetical protein